eukprot:126145_1
METLEQFTYLCPIVHDCTDIGVFEDVLIPQVIGNDVIYSFIRKKEIVPHALTFPANANQIMLERKSLDFTGIQDMRLESIEQNYVNTDMGMTDIVNTDNVQIIMDVVNRE